MDVEGLIDYLHQFEGSTKVYLTNDPCVPVDVGDFILLDALDYQDADEERERVHGILDEAMASDIRRYQEEG
jgi:hypothetical protein